MEEHLFAMDPFKNLAQLMPESKIKVDSDFTLSDTEKKLIAALFYSMEIEGESPELNCTFDTNELINFLHLKGDSKLKELQEMTFKLMGIAIETETGGIIRHFSFLSFVGYDEDKGTVTLSISSFWKPYILSLKKAIKVDTN